MVRGYHVYKDVWDAVVPCVQKQNGVKDCGLFAIAFTAFLVNGNNPEQLLTYTFQQDELRNHLVKCLEQGYVTPF